MMSTPPLCLTGFTFKELFQAEGLDRLDREFLAILPQPLHAGLLAYRNKTRPFSTLEISELLLGLAPILENFLITLFNIEEEANLLQAKTISHNPISAFKKFFILRRAKKQLAQKGELPSFQELNQWLEQELQKAPLKTDDKELAVALLAT